MNRRAHDMDARVWTSITNKAWAPYQHTAPCPVPKPVHSRRGRPGSSLGGGSALTGQLHARRLFGDPDYLLRVVTRDPPVYFLYLDGNLG
jgi:hypothetical protein